MNHAEHDESIGSMLASIAAALREVSEKLDIVAARVQQEVPTFPADDDLPDQTRIHRLETWAFHASQDISRLSSRLDALDGGDPEQPPPRARGTRSRREVREAAERAAAGLDDAPGAGGSAESPTPHQFHSGAGDRPPLERRQSPIRSTDHLGDPTWPLNAAPVPRVTSTVNPSGGAVNGHAASGREEAESFGGFGSAASGTNGSADVDAATGEIPVSRHDSRRVGINGSGGGSSITGATAAAGGTTVLNGTVPAGHSRTTTASFAAEDVTTPVSASDSVLDSGRGAGSVNDTAAQSAKAPPRLSVGGAATHSGGETAALSGGAPARLSHGNHAPPTSGNSTAPAVRESAAVDNSALLSGGETATPVIGNAVPHSSGGTSVPSISGADSSGGAAAVSFGGAESASGDGATALTRGNDAFPGAVAASADDQARSARETGIVGDAAWSGTTAGGRERVELTDDSVIEVVEWQPARRVSNNGVGPSTDRAGGSDRAVSLSSLGLDGPGAAPSGQADSPAGDGAALPGSAEVGRVVRDGQVVADGTAAGADTGAMDSLAGASAEASHRSADRGVERARPVGRAAAEGPAPQAPPTNSGGAPVEEFGTSPVVSRDAVSSSVIDDGVIGQSAEVPDLGAVRGGSEGPERTEPDPRSAGLTAGGHTGTNGYTVHGFDHSAPMTDPPAGNTANGIHWTFTDDTTATLPTAVRNGHSHNGFTAEPERRPDSIFDEFTPRDRLTTGGANTTAPGGPPARLAPPKDHSANRAADSPGPVAGQAAPADPGSSAPVPIAAPAPVGPDAADPIPPTATDAAGITVTGTFRAFDIERAHVDKLQAMLDELKRSAGLPPSRHDVFGPPTTEPS